MTRMFIFEIVFKNYYYYLSVFTVTFDKCNASLPNKMIHFFKRNYTDHEPLNGILSTGKAKLKKF